MPISYQYSNVATWEVCAGPTPRTPWSWSQTIRRGYKRIGGTLHYTGMGKIGDQDIDCPDAGDKEFPLQRSAM